MQFENFVMLNLPTKVDLANGIGEVEKDLAQYKKYVGENFMSATILYNKLHEKMVMC